MVKDVLHLKAPGNWMNDPNGFIYYQGKYHLFYQHFPYAPVWGTMHWGHAVSEDLVHWEHLDIALFPTKTYDQNGVFSGSAIEKDGKLYLYYTAVRYLAMAAGNIHRADQDQYESSQAVVISEDGYHFDNWKDKHQIIPVIRDEGIANVTHTRDPKVWKAGKYYYMILGSTYKDKEGRILFYKSEDGLNWIYADQYRNGNYGKILECPDLFRLGDDHIFVGSPMYIIEDGLEYPSHAICTLVDFEQETCRLECPDTYQFVDYGMDLYAPQSNIDKDGRRVLIGWMRMPKAVEKDGEKPWNGMMCLPRVVEVEDGHICFRVHPEVEKYFSERVPLEDVRDSGDRIKLPEGQPCRLRVALQEGEGLDIGGYRIWVENDCVKTDRSKVFAGIEGYHLTSSTPKVGGRYELDIFVEPNLIEIFVNAGQYVVSNVVYGLEDYVDGRVEELHVGSM